MVSIRDICKYLDEVGTLYTYFGDNDVSITDFSSLTNYKNNTITWCKEEKYIPKQVKEYAISITGTGFGHDNVFPNRIETNNPKQVFFDIVEKFFGTDEEQFVIGKGSIILGNVVIGENVRIGHNCTLHGNIKIGDNTVIYNNVNIINNVEIGDNCTIQSCVNIGHDDFAYTEDASNKKTMIKHYGGVQIGKDVFIGASTVINRGTIDDTIIGEGTKIDGLCHISHNVRIGKNSAIVTGSRLYGSVTTGENVYIASAIIKNQSKIGSNSTIGMGSVVLNDVEEGAVVVGTPAKRIR